MGFDAGSIKAYLELDDSDFNAKLDNAQRKASEFERKPVNVPVDADTSEFDAKTEEVSLAKDELGKRVSVTVSADTAEFDADAAAVEVVKEEVAKKVSIPVSMDLAELAAEAATAKAFLDELGRGSSMSGSSGLVQSIIGAGATSRPELTDALRSMGYSSAEANGAIAQFRSDARMLMGSYRAALDAAVSEAFSGGLPALGSGPGGGALSAFGVNPILEAFHSASGSTTDWNQVLPALPRYAWNSIAGELGSGSGGGALSPLGTGSTIFDAIARDVTAMDAAGGGRFSSLFSRMGNGASSAWSSIGGGASSAWARVFGGMENVGTLSGGTSAISQKLMNDAQYARQEMDRALMSSFGKDPSLFRKLQQIADSTGGKLTKDAADFLAKGIMAESKSSSGWVAQALGAGGSFINAAATTASSLPKWAKIGAFAAPLATPIFGGLGLALGGAVAGTAIGVGGLGTYGLLAMGAVKDISAAYTAQQQLQTGQITQAQYNQTVAGLTPAAVSAVQGGFGHQLSAFNDNTIHPLQNQIVGQLIGLFDKLVSVLPLVSRFMQTAVNAMGGFFGSIEHGMGSAGFKTFMNDMSNDLGPIMKDFGQVTINVGNAFGHFLELFGGAPARIVGAWFVRVTGELANFTAHAKINRLFIDGMKQALGFLGDTLKLVWDALKKVGDALAPIGLVMIKILTPAVKALDWVINAIPVNVLTSVAVAFMGWVALPMIIGGVSKAITLLATNPALLTLMAAAAAIGLVVTALHTPTSALNMQMKSKGMTDVQIKGAQGWLAGQHTGANYLDYMYAMGHGLNNSQIGLGAGAIDNRNMTPAQRKAFESAAGNKLAQPSMQSKILASLHRTLTAESNALKKFGGDLDGYYIHVQNFLDHTLNGIAQARRVFAHFFGDVGHWAVVGWQTFDNGLVHPIARFFVTDLPAWLGDGVSAVGNFFGAIGHWFVLAWQAVDNDFVHPIARFFTTNLPNWIGDGLSAIGNFFTNTIPHAFDTMISWFQGLPGRILGALSNGLTVLAGWGKDLIQGLANGISGAWHLVTGALRSIGSHIPGGSLIGKGMSAVGLGSFASVLGLSGHAYGGSFSPYQPILVGEHGPEIIYPTFRGSVTPNNRIGGVGGSGTVIQITVDARGATNPSATEEAARRGVGAVLPSLRAAIERGAA